METLGMACLFENCLKEVQYHLRKHKKCVSVLVQLVHALHQAQDLPPAENPDVLLKSIFDTVYCPRNTGNVTDDEKLEEISGSAVNYGIGRQDREDRITYEESDIDDSFQRDSDEDYDDDDDDEDDFGDGDDDDYDDDVDIDDDGDDDGDVDDDDDHDDDEGDDGDDINDDDDGNDEGDVGDVDCNDGSSLKENKTEEIIAQEKISTVNNVAGVEEISVSASSSITQPEKLVNEPEEHEDQDDNTEGATVNHVNGKSEDGDSVSDQSEEVRSPTVSDQVPMNQELSVLFLGGPKIGVKYQVEVTSSLNPDGTFWASHVEECGFINEKIHQLSETLRETTKNDSSLWKVDNYDEMVCVKSKDHGGLWMRAVVIKENDENSVKLLFIDIGRTESCDKIRLSKVPPPLCDIPYMAFHCALFEEPVTVPYEGRWRFSDICKQKILNFTYEKFMECNNRKYLLGKFQTILDDPVIDVAAEILKYGGTKCNNPNQQDTHTIVSRDIRTKDHTEGSGLTSVMEVIRSNCNETVEKCKANEQVPSPDEPLKQDISSQQKTSNPGGPERQILSSPEELDKQVMSPAGQCKPEKRKKPLAVVIPTGDGGSCYSSDDKLSWGDRKTPTSAEMVDLFHGTVNFTPDAANGSVEFDFEKKVKESPSDGVDDICDKLRNPSCGSDWDSLITNNTEQEKTWNNNSRKGKSSSLDDCFKNSRDNSLDNSSGIILTNKDAVLPVTITNGSSREESEYDGLSSPSNCIDSFPTNMIAPPSTIVDPLIKSEEFRQKMHKLQQLQFELQREVGAVGPQHNTPLLVDPTWTTGQCKRTTTPVYYHPNFRHPIPSVPSVASPERDVESPVEYTEGKMRGCSGYNDRKGSYPPFQYDRCVTDRERGGYRSERNAPLDAVDFQSDCNMAKPHRDDKIHTPRRREEGARRTGEMPHSSRRSSARGTHPIDINCSRGPRFFKDKVVPEKSVDGRRYPTQSRYSFANQGTYNYNGSPNAFPSSGSPPDGRFEKCNSVRLNRNSCGGARSIKRHSSGDEVKKFEEVTYERMMEESKNDWAAREIYNLTHPYIEHKNARFFSSRMLDDPGPKHFEMHLLNSLRERKLHVKKEDVETFQREWNDNNGPLFFFVRVPPIHRTKSRGSRGGGSKSVIHGVILQIITKLKIVPYGNRGETTGRCDVKFVSTAFLPNETPVMHLRTNPGTREVSPNDARTYIRELIYRLQDGPRGNCLNIFTAPRFTSPRKLVAEKTYNRSTSNGSNSNRSNSNRSNSNRSNSHRSNSHDSNSHENNSHTRDPLPGEDWDLTLDGMKDFPTNVFGSDDEGEQGDINLQMDVYGITDDDI